MNDEIPEDDTPRDLLGAPIDQAHETWGRSEFEKTKENQERVEVLAAAGWSQARIARHIGCDPKTLRKHFSRELSKAADDAEADALLAIHRRMKEGNVSAARLTLTLAEKGKAVPPPPPPEKPAPDAAPEEKLGKKARLEAGAKKPTGGWGEVLGEKGGRLN